MKRCAMAGFTPLVSVVVPTRDRPARELRAFVPVAISVGVIMLDRAGRIAKACGRGL